MTCGSLRTLTSSAALLFCLAEQLVAEPWDDFRAFCLPDGKALSQNNTQLANAGWSILSEDAPAGLLSAYVVLSEPGKSDLGATMATDLVAPDLSAYMKDRVEWAGQAFNASIESGDVLSNGPYILRRRAAVENGLAMVECKLFSSLSDAFASAGDMASSLAGTNEATDHTWWTQIAVPNRDAILALGMDANIQEPIANVDIVRFSDFASLHDGVAPDIGMTVGVHSLTIFKAQ